MIHPYSELRFISEEVGHGVFATRFIPKGTIVYIKDKLELIFPPGDPRREDPLYKEIIEKYSYTEPNGNYVFSWDIGRYVNHCCNCNIISTGYGFEIAIRDIQEGEEITDEYGLFNSGWEIDLVCSKPGCRGKLHPTDIDNHTELWDGWIRSALEKFRQVEQPLLKYIEPSVKRQLDEYLNSGNSYISVKTLKIG